MFAEHSDHIHRRELVSGHSVFLFFLFPHPLAFPLLALHLLVLFSLAKDLLP